MRLITTASPKPFPHKGLTSEYDPDDPRLVLTSHDYLKYRR